MGGTSDVTVEEAKASIARAEEAKAALPVEPQRMTMSEVFDFLEDMDADASTRPYGPILITDEGGGETMAALVPIELAQGVGWCAPSP